MSRFSVSLVSACAAVLLSAGCSRTPPNAASDGQKALREGDYERAVALLGAAARANPDQADLQYNLGMANLLASHDREAEEAFDRAVKLTRYTDDWAPLVARAETRRRRGKLDEAVTDYASAMGKANRLPSLLAGLAACEMDAGNVHAAAANLEEALTNDPDEPLALYNAGVLHASGRLAPAEPAHEHTLAAEFFVRFLTSSRAQDAAEQRADAVRRLHALAAARPAELQDKIDTLLMKSARAQSPAYALDRAVEAFRLDQSNPVALARMVAAARECRNDALARTLAARGRLLFPGDRRFPPAEARP